MQWHRVGSVGQFGVGRPTRVEVRGRSLAVGRVGERFFAVDNACPHAGWSLAHGTLEGKQLICGLHGWRFDVFSGKCELFDSNLATYPVRVEDGYLEILL